MIHVYTFIYDNYRIIDLPLYSVWTWLFSLLLVEFVYYWTHRALHEFNILWAAHQFHHMAEDLNITTTIRDSVVDLIIYDVCQVLFSLILFLLFLLTVFRFLDLSCPNIVFDTTTNISGSHAIQFDLSNLVTQFCCW